MPVMKLYKYVMKTLLLARAEMNTNFRVQIVFRLNRMNNQIV